MTVFRGASLFDHLSPGVKRLLIANVAVFFVQMIKPDVMIDYFALKPALLFKTYRLWQLVTYAFLHGNGWHLFFNMFALWMFGPHIETVWGTQRFLRYYLICVLGAAASQFVAAPNSYVIGASGGVYGLLIAFGLLFPDSVIYLFFIFPLRAIHAVLFIAALTFAASMSAGGSEIANFAHLGGMLTGFLYFKLPAGFRFAQDWWSQRRVHSLLRSSSVKPGGRDPGDEGDLSREVDRILEKISVKGLDSLTNEEHETMRRYAKKRK